MTKPVLWMPQNEIANSPSTPVVVEGGPYAGQMFIGDVTYGGLQRADLEKVDGRYQGALFRMTQGLEAGVSRVLKGADGSLIIGGLGAGGNWGQTGKLRYGLQKLDLSGDVPFDMESMDVVEGGFEITYTQPLSAATLEDLASQVPVEQWRYRATAQYGGPKLDEESLDVTSATASEDGRTVTLQVAGMKPDRVVHLRSPRPFASASDETLWSTEAWYTLNSYPGYVETDPEPAPDGIYELEDGELSGTAGVDDRARRLHRIGLRRRHPDRRLGHHGRGGGAEGGHLRPADPLRQRPQPAAQPDQEDEPLHRRRAPADPAPAVRRLEDVGHATPPASRCRPASPASGSPTSRATTATSTSTTSRSSTRRAVASRPRTAPSPVTATASRPSTPATAAPATSVASRSTAPP